MTVGPSLLRPDAHQAIHEASNGELAEVMDELGLLVTARDQVTASRVASALIETWRTRVLAHAAVEEESLYPLIRQRNPSAGPAIDALVAQHRLMNRLIDEASDLLTRTGQVTPEVLRRLVDATLINRTHGNDEMHLLSTGL